MNGRLLSNVLVACCISGLISIPAHAGAAEDAAEALARGIARYNENSLGQAREAFLEARRLAPDDAAVHRWLGTTEARLYNCADAIESFDHYLRLAPADDARRAEVVIERDTCRAALAKADKPPGQSGDADALLTVKVGVGGLIVGTLIAAAGGGVLLWARSVAGDYDSEYQRCFGMNSNPCLSDSFDGLQARNRQLNIAGSVLVGAGLLTALIGAITWSRHQRSTLLKKNDDAPAPAKSARLPRLAPSGMGALLSWELP